VAPKARKRPRLTAWCVRDGGLIRIRRAKISAPTTAVSRIRERKK